MEIHLKCCLPCPKFGNKQTSIANIIVLTIVLSICCFRVSAAGLTPINSYTNQALIGVWGSSKNDVFALGTGKPIIHFDGISWTKHYSGFSPIYYTDYGVV